MLVGLLAGLLGAGIAVAVIVGMPLGLFNRFLAVKPQAGVVPVGGEELARAILALNDERLPWSYTPTPDDQRADFVAEWKLTDARWWGVFSRNRLRKTYRAIVALDEAKHELRIVDESASVRWVVGANGPSPTLAWEGSFFRGVILFERSRELAYGLKEVAPLEVGRLYGYDFDPWRVKGPLLRTAIENGWWYCPVVMRSHLGRKARSAA